MSLQTKPLLQRLSSHWAGFMHSSAKYQRIIGSFLFHNHMSRRIQKTKFAYLGLVQLSHTDKDAVTCH